MTKGTTYRIPRPLGITQLMTEYHSSKDEDLLLKVRLYYIQQWLLSNGKVCGKLFNTNELASFLGCDPEMIRLQMRDQFLSTKLWNKENQEKLMESLIGQHITWAVEDRMEIENQVGILRASQGNKYTPFITSELNKAIGMKLTSTNTLGSIIRSLSGGGSINIFNQTNQQNIVNTLTIEEAMGIIQEEVKEIEKPQQIQYIENKYDVADLPEVVANKQIGIDTSKEGNQIGLSELSTITDNYRSTLEEFPEEHHDIRREIELNIDPYEEDPEISIY